MDRYVQFAVAAAMEAMRDSGLDLEAVDRERMGVTLGTAVGGTMFLEDDYIAVSNKGEEWLVDPEYSRPFLFQALMPSSLASEVALKFGAQGPSTVISTGCTSGIDAIGYGHQLIQDGEADIVIAGASESGISPISMACFDPIKATSRRNDDARAGVAAVRSRPRRLRDGRGRRDPDPGGVRERDGPRRARLLRGRGVCEPRQRVPHDRSAAGRGSRWRTRSRTRCARAASCPRTSATSTRTAPGRSRTTGTRPRRTSSRSASRRTRSRSARSSRWSATRSAASARSRWRPARSRSRRGVIPPTANWENPDPECDLDYTPKVARRQEVDAALSTGSGFGGFQSAIIFARPPELKQARRDEQHPSPVRRARGHHRARRRRAHRDRHRRLVAGDARGHVRDRPDHPLRPVQVRDPAGRRGLGLRGDGLHRQPADRPDRPLDVDGDGGRADGARRREGRPRGPRSVQDERHHRERVRRERVRPEGDPEPLGQGADLRRRLPVDRLVLRGDDGPDLDQVRDEGAVRRARLRGRRRPGGAVALAADDPARRRRRRQRRHRGARRAVRAHVPAAERPAERGARAGGCVPAVRPARERLRARRGRRDHHRRGRRRTRSSAGAPQVYGEILGYAATNDAHDPHRVPSTAVTWRAR